jgi:hypothetical protein
MALTVCKTGKHVIRQPPAMWMLGQRIASFFQRQLAAEGAISGARWMTLLFLTNGRIPSAISHNSRDRDPKLFLGYTAPAHI